MRAVRPITPAQRVVLETIDSHIETCGYSPSVRDLMELLGYSSPATVHRHLSALRDGGYIHWRSESPRTIRVLKAAA